MRLSNFKDERAVEVVADLLVPIWKIVSNPENAELAGKTLIESAAVLLKNNRREVMDMLAILSETAPEEYHCTAATVMRDVIDMIGDRDMMELFGLRSKTRPSSGSASENTEGRGE